MNYIHHEFMCRPRKPQGPEVLPSMLLGIMLIRRQLYQPFSQQIERALRHQLLEGFAIAREKELFTVHWLLFRT